MNKVTAMILGVFFANTAFAQEAAAPQAGFGSLVPLVLIFAIFYFLIIRPQGKKIKEHAQMVKSLHRGDRVVTAGGIEGVITKVEEGTGKIDVEISPGVVVKVVQSTITDVVSRGQAYEKSQKSSEKEEKNNKKAA